MKMYWVTAKIGLKLRPSDFFTLFRLDVDHLVSKSGLNFSWPKHSHMQRNQFCVLAHVSLC